MFVDEPKNPSGLCVVTDARLRSDINTRSVLAEWRFGTRVLGYRNWARVTRVALHEYKEDTGALSPANNALLKEVPEKKRKAVFRKLLAKQRAAVREQLLELLTKRQFKCVVILQSPTVNADSKDEDDNTAVNLRGTQAWAALEPPDSLVECSGTLWKSPVGPVMALLNPINYEFVYRELCARHLRAAWVHAIGKLNVLEPDPLCSSHLISDAHRARLFTTLAQSAEAGNPISVDLEAANDVITAIGLSDGNISISAPWDAFIPYGSREQEPRISRQEEQLVRHILNTQATKIFHNYSYDVPILRERHITLGGTVADTMAMHGIVYKQWRHGLQRAASSEYLVPPWKSLWKPQEPVAKQLTKADPEYWTLDITNQRAYNLKDSFYTVHLAKGLAPKLGIKL
jgi:hypothetical protein